MKSLYLFIIIIVIFSCATKKKAMVDTVTRATIIKDEPVTEFKVKGFRYTVPDDMEESPRDADSFRLNNMLIEKDKIYFQSSKIIAIRHAKNSDSLSLIDFAKQDQAMASAEKKLIYEKGWDAEGLNEKNIEHISYQFEYANGKQTVYQRSIYIKFENTFYIISYSTMDKRILLDKKNDGFWSSIRVD